MTCILGKYRLLNIRTHKLIRKKQQKKVDKHMNRWFTKEESQMMRKYTVKILTCKFEQMCCFGGTLITLAEIERSYMATWCAR